MPDIDIYECGGEPLAEVLVIREAGYVRLA